MSLAVWRCKHPSFPFLWLTRTSEPRPSRVRQLSTSPSPGPGAGSFRGSKLNAKEAPDAATTTGYAAAFANAQPGKSGRPRALDRTITTLDPKRLDPGCFLDISGTRRPFIAISFPDQGHLTQCPLIYRQTTVGPCHRPFPAGTRGFLYFYANPHSPLHSQLRFRVTEDSDPSSFSRGHDLVYDTGYVWYLPVATLACTASQGPLLRLLADDGLIDASTISALQNRSITRPNRVRRPISSLRESFALDLSLATLTIVVQAAGRDQLVYFRPPFVASTSKSASVSAYDEGLALCRFERSTQPEHTGRRMIALRLLKILVPPKLVSNPLLHAGTTLPAEGELFTKFGSVWYRDLDKDTKMARALRVLYDIDDGQEPG